MVQPGETLWSISAANNFTTRTVAAFNGLSEDAAVYAGQAYLYDLFLAEQGAPANPPGSSSHELGIAIDLAEPAMPDVVDQIGAGYGRYGINPSGGTSSTGG